MHLSFANGHLGKRGKDTGFGEDTAMMNLADGRSLVFYFLQAVQRFHEGTTSLSNSALLFQLPHFYDSGPRESAYGLE